MDYEFYISYSDGGASDSNDGSLSAPWATEKGWTDHQSAIAANVLTGDTVSIYFEACGISRSPDTHYQVTVDAGENHNFGESLSTGNGSLIIDGELFPTGVIFNIDRYGAGLNPVALIDKRRFSFTAYTGGYLSLDSGFPVAQVRTEIEMYPSGKVFSFERGNPSDPNYQPSFNYITIDGIKSKRAPYARLEIETPTCTAGSGLNTLVAAAIPDFENLVDGGSVLIGDRVHNETKDLWTGVVGISGDTINTNIADALTFAVDDVCTIYRPGIDADHPAYYHTNNGKDVTERCWVYLEDATLTNHFISRNTEAGFIAFYNCSNINFSGLWMEGVGVRIDNDSRDLENVSIDGVTLVQAGLACGTDSNVPGLESNNINIQNMMIRDVGDNAMSIEMTGSGNGINIIKNVLLKGNEIKNIDGNNETRSWHRGEGRYRGEWFSGMRFVKNGDVVITTPAINGTGNTQIVFYKRVNTDGTAGVDPLTPSNTDWEKTGGGAGYVDNEGIAIQCPGGNVKAQANYIHDGCDGGAMIVWCNTTDPLSPGRYNGFDASYNIFRDVTGPMFGMNNGNVDIVRDVRVHHNIGFGTKVDVDGWFQNSGHGDGARIGGRSDLFDLWFFCNVLVGFEANINHGGIAAAWDIFQNLSLAPTKHHVRYETNNAGKTQQTDYNRYFPEVGNMFRYRGADYDLAGYIAATAIDGFTDDVHSSNNDPFLVNYPPTKPEHCYPRQGSNIVSSGKEIPSAVDFFEIESISAYIGAIGQIFASASSKNSTIILSGGQERR